jgi:hypothetical protein
MVLSKHLETLKKTQSKYDDVIDLQVVALERGKIYNSELVTIQNLFSQSELAYSRLPSCLELTEVKFS